MIQKSTSLKYEPSSEPLLITVKQLFLNNFLSLLWGGRSERRCECKTKHQTPRPSLCTGELNAIRKQNAFSAVLSTAGRVVGLCWAKLKPKGPKGPHLGSGLGVPNPDAIVGASADDSLPIRRKNDGGHIVPVPFHHAQLPDRPRWGSPKVNPPSVQLHFKSYPRQMGRSERANPHRAI